MSRQKRGTNRTIHGTPRLITLVSPALAAWQAKVDIAVVILRGLPRLILPQGARELDHCDPQFESLLKSFETESLESHHGAVLGLWSDFKLAYVNPAWFRFARENDGEPAITRRFGIGTFILDAIGDELRPFYEQALRRCSTREVPWEHEYECSSPYIYRRFHMTVYTLEKGRGLLEVHSAVMQRPHDPLERPPKDPSLVLYYDEYGQVLQCAHCRRVRAIGDKERWDWVPEWVANPPAKTSHGLCYICADYYYPGQRRT